MKNQKIPAWLNSGIMRKPFMCVAAEVIIIASFLVTAIILAASNKALWVDEVYSLAPSRHSWEKLLLIEAADVHPPFFFLLVKLCSLVFGGDIFVMKLISIVPVVLTMVCMCVFLRKEFSDKTAILFLLCFSASQSVVHYSIEIRMYSWAFFFVTMAAMSIWYMMNARQLKWWLWFLLFAEGAAYTHFYAALAVFMLYFLLFFYLMQHDRKSLITYCMVALLAFLLYLPWLHATINAFTKSSGSFWIAPLNLSAIVSYVYFVFNAGNKITSLLLLLLFIAAFIYFCVKNKDGKDRFAFGGLCSVMLIMALAILVMLLIKPLFTARYLFPACGLVWLFFAVEWASLADKRIFIGLCSVLLIFAVINLSATLKRERIEDAAYTEYYSYISENINDGDMFVLPPANDLGSSHLIGINAYLFPNRVYVCDEYGGTFGEKLYWEMFNSSRAGYAELSDSDRLGEKAAWIIVQEDMDGNRYTDIDVAPLCEFRGLFGWGFYRFRLYYIDSAAKLAVYNR